MGKKKKFIEKKKSATFQLLARDSSDPNYDGTPGSDRIFVRVDNHPYSVNAFEDDGPVDAPGSGCFDEDPNSIFADAPDDYDDEGDRVFGTSVRSEGRIHGAATLPERIRKEILDLGFPDDGYNYLLHLRDIKQTGGGSAFYHNPKVRLDRLPCDVKAYDASGVPVFKGNSDADENIIFKVASKTVGVKIQNALDPEIAALLDDDGLSQCDAEDLEEDFATWANLCEEGEDAAVDNRFNVVEDSKRIEGSHNIGNNRFSGDDIFQDADMDPVEDKRENSDADKPRIRRLLDEQFDTLLSQDYASSDNDGSDYDKGDGRVAEEDESLAQKLKHTLGDYATDDVELDKVYKTPAEILNCKGLENKELESANDVIHRCMEYAEKYQNEDDNDHDFIFEESSDESEVWDCETIMSTCSNLNNHPAKIEAPELTRRKKLAETVSVALNANSQVITLRGKEKLPVDFLPHGRKLVDKVKDVGNLRTEHQKRKQRGQESKEEKKERKAAIKEERCEARRMKKEMKGLYKGEAKHAQKVVAISGPSSIHIM